eukprot:TRINITY_DN10307_c0_g1_i1.p1 TRINITY_DN10307_c0_g1~~TRINITY_DN10307_c0_g1_i1.p1  ORF type:complete len:156 (-),score=24.66 TRINITY_DN10307_c0_g1_i1:9-413(-)
MMTMSDKIKGKLRIKRKERKPSPEEIQQVINSIPELDTRSVTPPFSTAPNSLLQKQGSSINLRDDPELQSQLASFPIFFSPTTAVPLRESSPDPTSVTSKKHSLSEEEDELKNMEEGVPSLKRSRVIESEIEVV